MRKVSLLLLGLLILSFAAMGAPPQAVAVAASPAQEGLTAPSALFAPPGVQACTLLCIIGRHCCVMGGHQSCIPNGIPCVAS